MMELLLMLDPIPRNFVVFVFCGVVGLLVGRLFIRYGENDQDAQFVTEM